MKFDSVQACKLWIQVFKSGYEWFVRDEIETIAGQCGLGVLTVAALNEADFLISKDMRDGRRWMPEENYRQLNIAVLAPKWARAMSYASERFPTDEVVYPMVAEANHVCVGQARKGKWSDEQYRAAWGNVPPFGLQMAIKPCPFCNEEMRYWCYGKRGEAQYKWSVDHGLAHAAGGCVCNHNLKAIHASCNSAKGRY